MNSPIRRFAIAISVVFAAAIGGCESAPQSYEPVVPGGFPVYQLEPPASGVGEAKQALSTPAAPQLFPGLVVKTDTSDSLLDVMILDPNPANVDVHGNRLPVILMALPPIGSASATPFPAELTIDTAVQPSDVGGLTRYIGAIPAPGGTIHEPMPSLLAKINSDGTRNLYFPDVDGTHVDANGDRLPSLWPNVPHYTSIALSPGSGAGALQTWTLKVGSVVYVYYDTTTGTFTCYVANAPR